MILTLLIISLLIASLVFPIVRATVGFFLTLIQPIIFTIISGIVTIIRMFFQLVYDLPDILQRYLNLFRDNHTWLLRVTLALMSIFLCSVIVLFSLKYLNGNVATIAK